MTRTKAEPHVGIYWYYRSRLLKASVPVANGLRYGDAIHSQVDHVRFWPELQHRIAALRDLEYEQVPRGRVVFMHSTKRFHVYMDKKLHTARIKNLLMKEFRLAKGRTDFLSDPHYTTDVAELNRLFNEQ